MNINNNYSNVIYKSNKLIESCYNLTTTQNRVLYLAMTKLETRILEKNLNIKQVEDLIYRASFDLIDVDVDTYKKTFGLNSNSLYKDLEKVATELYESEILYVDSKDNFIRKRWVITCRYDNNKKGIALQFHPDLISDLLIFKSEYTKMIFDEFANKMKKKHSFRTYELCKQYVNYGYRDFYVDDYRFKLDLNDGEYSIFRDFKKKVIDASIDEINKYTDLQIEYKELERKKRAVNKFRFIIKKKDCIQLNMFEKDKPAINNTDGEHVVNMLSHIINRQVKPGEAKTILSTALTAIEIYPDLKERNLGVVDYIKEKMIVVNQYITYSKKEINYIGALIIALKNNWQNTEVDNLVNTNVQLNSDRDYNYDNLEQMLLGNMDYDPNSLYK
ncbi:replication initiation protein [Clostridium perfringens]|uniref:replication initiation protein n=1 Tax=Clostridium perfringens TaxID=1502 RepID=UPI003F42FEBF